MCECFCISKKGRQKHSLFFYPFLLWLERVCCDGLCYCVIVLYVGVEWERVVGCCDFWNKGGG